MNHNLHCCTSNLISRSLQVGGIFLNRQVTDDTPDRRYNRSFGADAHLRLFRNMVIQSYLAATKDDGVAGNNRAARISVAWRDKFWNTSVMFRAVGDAFNPELGSSAAEDTAQLCHHRYTQRRAAALINEVNPFVEVDYITNLESVLETRTATIGVITSFLDGSRLTLQYNDRFERLFEPFPVLAEREVPAGSYDSARQASIINQVADGSCPGG